MARIVLHGSQGRQLIELGAVTRIGRHPNSTIQILDGMASKEHCAIDAQGNQMILRDLGSSNGTHVGPVRLTAPHVLRHGDEIRIGNTTMIFDDGVSSVPIATPPPSAGAVQHAVAGSAVGLPTQAAGWRTATPPPAPPPVSVEQSAYEIGRQVAALSKDFVPFDEVASDPAALRLDYERLRITWELLREIGLERDIERLLEKILVALFRFVQADRGVILLRETDGTLTPRAHRRRDNTTTEIKISSTILAHVVKERAGVLSHDASSDFGASQGKSMFLNQISSAIVVPLLHDRDVIGVLWLDSQRINIFKPKDLELITAVGNQVAMLVANNLLASKVEKEIMTRKRFSRLLSPNVAEQVISGQLEIAKGGIQVPEATVFNSDLRGFTRMSEGTTAERDGRAAQRVLRADGRGDLQVRGHARQVHGRRHHGVLGRAGRERRRRGARDVVLARSDGRARRAQRAARRRRRRSRSRWASGCTPAPWSRATSVARSRCRTR